MYVQPEHWEHDKGVGNKLGHMARWINVVNSLVTCIRGSGTLLACADFTVVFVVIMWVWTSLSVIKELKAQGVNVNSYGYEESVSSTGMSTQVVAQHLWLYITGKENKREWGGGWWAYHDALLFLARILALVHVIVAVALVVLRQL